MAGDGGGYDLVAFGEAMVRLCPPGFGRVEAATMLEMLPGGAELNTAVGVADGDATAVLVLGALSVWLQAARDASPLPTSDEESLYLTQRAAGRRAEQKATD